MFSRSNARPRKTKNGSSRGPQNDLIPPGSERIAAGTSAVSYVVPGIDFGPTLFGATSSPVPSTVRVPVRRGPSTRVSV